MQIGSPWAEGTGPGGSCDASTCPHAMHEARGQGAEAGNEAVNRTQVLGGKVAPQGMAGQGEL